MYLWIPSSLRSGCTADSSKTRLGPPPRRALKRTFPTRRNKGPKICSKVHLVRYADDFIITGRSQSQLVNEVLPLVEKFLRERGLELSAEKTHVTHIQKGFDFLGQNIRKYGRKLLITPAQKNVQAALTKI